MGGRISNIDLKKSPRGASGEKIANIGFRVKNLKLLKRVWKVRVKGFAPCRGGFTVKV